MITTFRIALTLTIVIIFGWLCAAISLLIASGVPAGGTSLVIGTLARIGLMSASCLSGGALVGFLFGIRPVQSDRVRTNLEQISDLLSKLLVGAGLVLLPSLPSGLNALPPLVSFGAGPPPWGTLITAVA
jgi:hypothetical protein